LPNGTGYARTKWDKSKPDIKFIKILDDYNRLPKQKKAGRIMRLTERIDGIINIVKKLVPILMK